MLKVNEFNKDSFLSNQEENFDEEENLDEINNQYKLVYSLLLKIFF